MDKDIVKKLVLKATEPHKNLEDLEEIKEYERQLRHSTLELNLEDLKDIYMTANALILVHRTNRKNPYYTKLWKTLRQNKNPIVRGLRA